jgi:ferredoxin-like protein FixX
MSKTKNQIVLEKFQKIHGNKFDYSKVEYITAKTKVIIICEEHGDFLVTPNNHLSGHGCPKCAGRGFSEKEMFDTFVDQSNEIHQYKYDYSQVDFSKKKLAIICPDHSIFFQTKRGHVTNKSGCPRCGTQRTIEKTLLPKETFIEKSVKKHGQKYSYDKVIYQGAHKKVIIICPEHGDFSITPANHWSRGVGCPSCLRSNPTKGETIIYSWLRDHNILFETQKTFPDLFFKSKKGRLKYDAYVEKLNLLIEYDGEYHYKPMTFSKSISANDLFSLTQERDRIKNEYAKKKGINLLRIRFDENIIQKLETFISKLTQ